MTVDYRLLHQFRVSQRREMAARGELPTQFHGPDPLVPGTDVPFEDVEEAGRPNPPQLAARSATSTRPRTVGPSAVARSQTPRQATPRSASPRPERGQVLTQLLNEDR